MQNLSIFYATYIIDGMVMDSTPAQLLSASPEENPVEEPVVDENLDMSPGGYVLEAGKTAAYLRAIKGKNFPLEYPYAGFQARCGLAYALIDALWTKGRFLLEDLSLEVDWTWRNAGLGSCAALYNAADKAAELADELDLPIVGRHFSEGEAKMVFHVSGAGTQRSLPDRFVADESSWIIYIPFDVDEYHLGGSELSAALGLKGGACARMVDADYFIDCFEVVRELVEDGILLSGSTVGRGGLMKALDALCPENVGVKADLSELKRAVSGSDVVRLLFSEVPGAVVQIKDDDFDYVDAELLLQDVMYFPLGHPVKGRSGVEVCCNDISAIGGILNSLIR